MPHTDNVTVVAVALYNLINANKGSLGINIVLFGNQNMIPSSPAVVVNPGTKRRDLAGVSAPGGRVMNEMSVFIDVHSSKVGDEFAERLAVDQLAEAVEVKIHSDVTLGGILIHGFVNEWDPGETFIQGSAFRTVRMTFIGKTKTYLSSS